MNKKILIVINNLFPYGKSEDFLANELNYVDGFDEIIVVPILIFGQKSIKEIVYNDIIPKIFFVNPSSSFRKIVQALKLVPSIFFSREIYKEIVLLIKDKRFTFSNLKELLSFLLISNNAFSQVHRKIRHLAQDSDVVIYSYWLHCAAMVAVLLKDKIGNVEKVIARCHRYDVYEYATKGNYIPMRKYISSGLDEIHSISLDASKYLRSNKYIFNEKIYLSRLGTVDHGCSISAKSKVLKLVSCSWLRPVKRVRSIVDAISNTNTKLNWVHYGDGEELGLVNDLIKQVTSPLVSCTLKGAYTNFQVLQEYRVNNYEVFVNVSENEGIPVSIMEAMSFGMIIIATDVGGTAEIVENGINGFLLNKDFKKEELSALIDKIGLFTELEFDAMRKRSRLIWEERCDAKYNYGEFYRNLKNENKY